MAEELSVDVPPDTLLKQKIHLLGMNFAVSEYSHIGTTVYQSDFEGNLHAVRDTRKSSDWVIVSLHSHEVGNEEGLPAQFAVEFARACIDHGADTVLMHGSHSLLGIEIYQGRPILYGLGNFIYQSQCITKLPADVYESYRLSGDSNPNDVHALVRKAFHLSSSRNDMSPYITGSAHLARVKQPSSDLSR